MFRKSLPVGVNQTLPSPHIGVCLLAIESGLDGGRVNDPIRLRKIRQATDSDLADGANEPSHPNHQNCHDCALCEITVVIPMNLQAVGEAAIRAVFRTTNSFLVVLLDVLLWR
jgi:NAD-dependent dihydropyrimidine dehydrogenase PreA subunit